MAKVVNDEGVNSQDIKQIGSLEITIIQWQWLLDMTDAVCRKYGITRFDLHSQNEEVSLLVLEEVHWRTTKYLHDQWQTGYQS
jgi:hypothetical protein